jgi:dTDP-4-amino-4,6-dideoxygalactose transaminase
MIALELENIESRPIWKPMHLQPIFNNCDFMKADDTMENVSDDVFHRGLCLPSDIKNTEEDMEQIINIIHNLFEK